MDGHVSKPFKQAVLLAALENATALPTNTEWAATPAAAGHADAEVGLPVLDRAVFEEITDGKLAPDFEDEVIAGSCVTREES